MEKDERGRRLNKTGLIIAIVGLSLAPFIIWYFNIISQLAGTCFSAGTKVLLADGSSKNIESLEVSAQVLTCNLDTGQTEADEVLELYTPANDNMMRMEFSDGTVIRSTFDHPYYVKNKGWCSLRPDVTNDLITNITGVGQ